MHIWWHETLTSFIVAERLEKTWIFLCNWQRQIVNYPSQFCWGKVGSLIFHTYFLPLILNAENNFTNILLILFWQLWNITVLYNIILLARILNTLRKYMEILQNFQYYIFSSILQNSLVLTKYYFILPFTGLYIIYSKYYNFIYFFVWCIKQIHYLMLFCLFSYTCQECYA